MEASYVVDYIGRTRTRFTVQRTRGRSNFGREENTKLAGKRVETRHKTILLVEDSPDDATLTLRALKQNDIASDVAIARDGVEAIDYLFATDPSTGEPNNQLPALILLDLKLPKIDGLEVLARVRADPRTRLLTVVVLTSSNEERDIRECYRLGANSYIRKPVDFSEFTQAIGQIGNYWLVLNQSAPRA